MLEIYLCVRLFAVPQNETVTGVLSFCFQPGKGLSGVLQVLLPIRGHLDGDIAKAEMEIKGLAGRLGNPNFADKAPPSVVAECKANLAEAESQAALARRRLEDLS